MLRALVVLALVLPAGACAGARTVVPVAVDCLRVFETDVDRHASFRAAFGPPPEALEQGALAHLASAIR